MALPALSDLPALLGNIDIYLFDQLLKGRVKESMKLLDAGCGNGRNIRYLMASGVEVYGADTSAEAIGQVQQLASQVAPQLPAQNFVISDTALLPYPDNYFDVVLCSAVLHFAQNEKHFRSMVQEMWRVLKTGGMFFSRLSTTIGMEGKFRQVQERRYQMPHGDVWFLADEEMLELLEEQLCAQRLEPLKTVLVEKERSMTTWVLQKQV
ncbi:class I SAM-dependent methyltransferase [Pontibacter liquoris]|uniref:class I SAM-dependent methyltransferase n=1 Tax=Pontibacter liquoris TaxID=2905677 RepID=UPI001FA77D35|nr:class I SAM-dependent methyltransferase [Pontibacter liquoris]